MNLMNSNNLYLFSGMMLFALIIHAQDAEEDLENIQLMPNFENGMRIYKKCATCHTPTDSGDQPGNYPQIAGQHIKVIIKELTNIRHGDRENIIMVPFSRHKVLGGINNLVDVAGYISRLPICPDNEIGPGNDLAHGAQLYNTHCAQCHAITGEGSNEDICPRIYGQHFSYLLRQIRWFIQGQRHNTDPIMIKKIKHFNERDQKAMADYISRLRPPAELLSPSACYK